MQSRKPKVVHMTSVHVPTDTRIAYRECATLVNAGYDVVLIAAGKAEGLPPGVRLRSVPVPANRFQRMIKTVWHVYVAALRERAELYHFHDPELMGVGLALRALGARVVFDVHEDIPRDIADKPWIPPFLRGSVSMLSVLVLRALHRCYSAVVTATPAIARRFPHRRTVVVCNYPNIDELPASTEGSFASRARAAVYLGEMSELRCIEEMIKAIDSPALGENIRLQLAGRFETEELEQRIRSMPQWKRVDYLGYCPRSQVPRVLSNARAGLLLFRPAANHLEAMPTKLFEYLGAGLPVIVSNTFERSSIVQEYECGIVVDPFDITAIARAMTFLIENPAIAEQMGERGRQLIANRYQWTSEAKKLTTLYAQIV